MGKERFGHSAEITGKLKRVIDEALGIDLIDVFVMAGIFGTALFIKEYVETQKIEIKKRLVRARENRNIAPLNPNIVREIEHIASSKF